jgi:peptidyl-tRNA hydrolase, PTH1 family
MYIVVGLGNPGEDYACTRHNTGRMCADFLADKVKGIKVFTPDTYMNKTGPAVAKVLGNPSTALKARKAAEKLIVIYDELDLPLGKIKISYNRSSGGHRGVESIIKALKTEAFIRIRVGISPTTPSGKLKKPMGEQNVEKHILSEFKKAEADELKKVFKRVAEAVQKIVDEGLTQAMTEFNK